MYCYTPVNLFTCFSFFSGDNVVLSALPLCISACICFSKKLWRELNCYSLIQNLKWPEKKVSISDLKISQEPSVIHFIKWGQVLWLCTIRNVIKSKRRAAFKLSHLFKYFLFEYFFLFNWTCLKFSGPNMQTCEMTLNLERGSIEEDQGRPHYKGLRNKPLLRYNASFSASHFSLIFLEKKKLQN